MSSAHWASAARGAKYQQEAEDQRAIDVLEMVMLGKRDTIDAANDINAIYEPLIKASKTNAVDRFWAILSSATRACADAEKQVARLVDLIIAIQGFPHVIDASGLPVKYLHGGVYWEDLPGWGVAFREYGIDVDGPDDFSEWAWHDQAEPLLNATRFAATLLVRAPFRTGMQFHACTALECALRPWSGDTQEHQYAELYLPSAASWILIAGQELREACMHSLESGHVSKLIPKRWNEWNQQFLAIAANPEYSANGRSWAQRAASHMEAMPA